MLLVSHREQRVTLVLREGGLWVERDFERGEVVVPQPEIRFQVADVYVGIVLDPA